MRSYEFDLYVLAADQDIRATVRTLLDRPNILGIRKISHFVDYLPLHDSGFIKHWDKTLRPLLSTYDKAMLVFDKHGSDGRGSSADIEKALEEDMSKNGWKNRCKAIAIDPEVEAWIWTGSNKCAEILNWSSYEDLRKFLNDRGMWPEEVDKPPKPKTAYENLIRHSKVRKSPSIFSRIANSVNKANLENCEDEAFNRFRSALQLWFPK